MTVRIGDAIATPFMQGTPEWEAARLAVIGSSTIPIITGNSLYGTSKVMLWANMTGLLPVEPPDAETAELFDLGHRFEPLVAELYTARTARPLRRVRPMLVNRHEPWMAASLDRVSAVKGERIIVECKWSPYSSFTGEGEDEVPAHVVDQCQWQMLVTGYEVTHVAVVVGGRFRWHEIKADPSHQADLRALGLDFLERVRTRVRPEVDGSDATRRALTGMFSADLELLDATDELESLALAHRSAEEAQKAATAEYERVRNLIRAALTDAGAEGWSNPDLYRVTWRADKNGRRTLSVKFKDEVGRWH